MHVRFRPPRPSEIQGHEQSAVVKIAGRLNKSGNLFGTEDGRQFVRLLDE
jgi:hypothetical protein